MWHIKSEFLSVYKIFGDEEHHQTTEGIVYTFSQPESFDGKISTGWQNQIFDDIWKYSLIVEFESALDDPKELVAYSTGLVDSVLAKLSFIKSTPTELVSYGSISDSPVNREHLVTGSQYRTIGISSDVGTRAYYSNSLIVNPLSEEQIELVFSGLDQLDERVTRGIKWLQRSYYSFLPSEEFTYLIIAIETVAPLLSTSDETLCWTCKNGHDFSSCPTCGISTLRKKSGDAKIREFCIDILGVDADKWRSIWDLRSRILHGDKELTAELQRNLSGILQELEGITLLIYRHLIHGTTISGDPLGLRPRSPFGHGSILNVNWEYSSESVDSN